MKLNLIRFQVFSKAHIKRMFDLIKTGNQHERVEMLKAMTNIAEKHAAVISEFFPLLCDYELFDEELMDSRSTIIAHVGGVNKVESAVLPERSVVKCF